MTNDNRLLGVVAALLLGSALLGALGCVGERPLAPPPAVDQPQGQPRCRGDATRLLGDVAIRSAADLEIFSGCKEIVGNVVIEGVAGVSDLSALSSFETIDGFLYIADNPDLESLAGLENVVRVERGISIENHPALLTIDFERLREAKGNLVIEGNPLLGVVNFPVLELVEPALVDIDGQGTLAPQGGALVLANNPALAAPLGFPALFEVDGDVDLHGLDALETLEGFSSLTEITGNFSLGVQKNERGEDEAAPNSSLSSLSQLNLVESLGGSLTIGFQPSLVDVDIGQLAEIEGDLILFGNESLTSLAGLQNLERIGGDLNLGQSFDFEGELLALGNPEILELGAPSLREIGGRLIAVGNAKLLSVSDLDALESIGGDIILLDNRALADLEMPPNIDVLAGDLIAGVSQDQNGVTLILENGTSAFGAPTFTEVSGDLVIGGLSATDLSAFANITRIGGALRLVQTRLTSTAGMVALVELGALQLGVVDEFEEGGVQRVTVLGNASLTDIEGLDAVTQLGSVRAVANDNLVNVDLPAIAIAGDVVIAMNPVLTSLNFAVPSIGGSLHLGVVPLPSGRTHRSLESGVTSIDLAALTSVGGDVVIAELSALTSLRLPLLASTGRDLILRDLDSVNVAAEFDALTTVGGDFVVADLELLPTLTIALTSVGANLRLRDVPLLDVTFDTVTTVEGELEITRTSTVSPSFLALTTVGASVVVDTNAALANLDGFAALQSVGTDLVLRANPSLVDVAGLAALTQVEGNIIAQENAALDVTALTTLADALDPSLEGETTVLTCGNNNDDAC